MKIQFFYSSGHSFTATNVVNYGELDPENMYYETVSYRGDVRSEARHEVPMFDLLFAVVTPSANEAPLHGSIHTSVIIHGLATKFDINVAPAQMVQIVDDAHEEALSDERHRVWKEEEAAKYRARQKARNATPSIQYIDDECLKCRI